ncbi:MAG TPA: hypothetical protein ENL37_02705 [Desulfobacteraceae bacterium]|nr:hypothetical protein [Desulfobacteraceae bacterium]
MSRPGAKISYLVTADARGGSGLSNIEAGLRLRYEIKKSFEVPLKGLQGATKLYLVKEIQ